MGRHLEPQMQKVAHSSPHFFFSTSLNDLIICIKSCVPHSCRGDVLSLGFKFLNFTLTFLEKHSLLSNDFFHVYSLNRAQILSQNRLLKLCNGVLRRIRLLDQVPKMAWYKKCAGSWIIYFRHFLLKLNTLVQSRCSIFYRTKILSMNCEAPSALIALWHFFGYIWFQREHFGFSAWSDIQD